MLCCARTQSGAALCAILSGLTLRPAHYWVHMPVPPRPAPPRPAPPRLSLASQLVRPRLTFQRCPVQAQAQPLQPLQLGTQPSVSDGASAARPAISDGAGASTATATASGAVGHALDGRHDGWADSQGVMDEMVERGVEG